MFYFIVYILLSAFSLSLSLFKEKRSKGKRWHLYPEGYLRDLYTLSSFML